MDKKMLQVSRANMYRFLSRLYLLEVDEALWNDMAKMTFPTAAAEGDLKDGYEMVANYLKANAEGNMTEVLDDLAVGLA